MAIRFNAVIAVFLLIFGLLGFNLYRLQVLKSDYYVSRAEARNAAREELDLRRGQIFFTDRSGNEIPAAMNRDYPVIYAVPKEIKESVAAAKALAPLINADEAKLAGDLNNPKSLFKLLVDKATDGQIAQVKALDLPGIYFDTKQHRFYPFSDLGANLIGFVGVNSENDQPVGLYGLEKIFDKTLSQGNDVRLTIDRNLEAEAERVLSDLVDRFQSPGGTVLIQEPKTGKILALANVPDFDPNQYSKYPVKDFMNQAVQLVYEPGSVFKPLTMSAAIDSGAITSSTTYVDKGYLVVSGHKITNWDHKAYGKATMTNVIEHSVNTGAAFAEQAAGNATFRDYLKKFGFGAKTGVDLPDEVTGSLYNLDQKNPPAIAFANASFGQGVSVTPIQLITAFSSIANGGLLMKPYLDASNKPEVVNRVMSGVTAEEVTQMMESAVNLAGVATISEYNVAGKTGTAQIPNFGRGGYLPDQYIHSYVGFAPATDARFVILIKIDKPNQTLAAETVVPAFQQLAQYVLNYYNIPPDRIVRQ
ncbi:MAG: Peptidoglycan glycosyltransferase [Candidatus Jorgensenbacteria bacterium GW2011_GWA1_48_11]|uniref:Peptidoglycan glycosyltransferase n=1 Tax=Candidatus Jorgensenbacteria bacterium GW2011_GWA1_48_11 TaxID=1618660 RepID=A0A0G1UAC0_9BACT|nr:MAG: Peptidoglycan glycosyltransferase [Candidatus Jorgensenbacteria bacterium GW2011_GWA1_48_11]KKW11795.1 MAG: Peptidoglycan glycosyltransferase [Candidatus Jorgensenbacteria bacterium GW2011_GWB1_49_9]